MASLANHAVRRIQIILSTNHIFHRNWLQLVNKTQKSQKPQQEWRMPLFQKFFRVLRLCVEMLSPRGCMFEMCVKRSFQRPIG